MANGSRPTSPRAEAVERLYQVFGRYPLRAVVEGCPHCVGPEDHATLRAAPLRVLTSAQLKRFAAKAMTTWGDEDDFRHFLPRLLELGDLDGLGGKLRHANWSQWPADERAAVDGFLSELWRERLDVPLLDELAVIYDDIEPFLVVWKENPDATKLAAAVPDERLSAPWVRDALETAFFAADSAEAGREFSDAVRRWEDFHG
ncbi:hypothetical protein [Allokutzneria oryzae]|uniref:CdiI immunity protein domain-containing protein n=1 Tax=Allokutzneria oryzae TaxID=1378989 RepID=A0ABV5ZNU7_9PSEU